ncbi:MAG: S9 family peptidase [Phycisphaerales bacterium]
MTFSSVLAADAPTPPVAAKKPHATEIHGQQRADDYFWLRERENPEVITHLKAENTYTEAMTSNLKGLETKLYDEMLGRIKQTDLSVPYRENGYFYYSRTEEGKSYPIHCRKKSSLDAPEEVMLDVNKMAEGKPTLFISPLGVSPDNTILAFGEDPTGGRIVTIRFKNLKTGELLPDSIPGTAGDMAWFGDSKTIAFVTQDHALRAAKVFRSALGKDHSKAELLLDETDERFDVGVSPTLSRKFILMHSTSMKTGEYWFLATDNPTGAFQVIEPRRQGIEYSVVDHGDKFLIRHNDGAINFTLVEAPIASPGRANWKTVIPHNENSYLTGVTAFKDFLVIQAREGGLGTIRIRKFSDGTDHVVKFPEEAYSVFPRSNAEYDTSTLRLNYASFITPSSVFDYDMSTRTLTLLKEQPVLGGYDRTKYTSTRFFAKAPDGADVPVTVVHRKDLKLDGSNPTLLYSYGSYGINTEVSFSSSILSLLDRGMVYAIAQIRGGSDKGRLWYEQGRMMNKKNTFTDFIAAAEGLIAKGYTKPEKLAIRGGSAGGLLMGAVTNMRPDLFKAVIADVAFVDVINTMLDKDLPLTVAEYEQWGNPNEKPAYDYMITYSPYDNVAKKSYPAILATTGLYDSQVSYWEPTKWVQKLRAMKTDNNVILLKINMEAAHGGSSGRYARMKEDAFRYAWMLNQLGITQ